MFADSLLDSRWADRSRRGWTTLASFTAQAVAAGVLFLLPLFYTQVLPQFQLVSRLVAPSPPPAPPAPEAARNARANRSNLSPDSRVMAPLSVPREIASVDEPSAPPAVDVSGLGVIGSTGTSPGLNGVLDSIGSGFNTIAPPPPTPSVHPPRVSCVMKSHLSRATAVSTPGAAGADSRNRSAASNDLAGGQD
jgi:hypothetical protein